MMDIMEIKMKKTKLFIQNWVLMEHTKQSAQKRNKFWEQFHSTIVNIYSIYKTNKWDSWIPIEILLINSRVEWNMQKETPFKTSKKISFWIHPKYGTLISTIKFDAKNSIWTKQIWLNKSMKSNYWATKN